MIRGLAFLFLVGILPVCLAQSNVHFRHLGDEFSYSTVTSFFQDQEDFIWIGTQNGLYRYNGHDMDFFGSAPDSTGLSNTYVRSVAGDQYGNIWTATLNGMNCYNNQTKSFSHYGTSAMPGEIVGFNQNHIRLSTDDRLWLSSDSGAYVFDPETKQVLHHYLSGKSVRFTAEDTQGNTWIGSEDLYLVHAKTQRIINFNKELKTPTGPVIKNVNSITWLKGSVWVATDFDGLFELTPRHTGLYRIKHYLHQPDNPNSLPHNSVLSLLGDRHQNLWVGTQNGGLCRFEPESQTFQRYKSPTMQSIWAIMEDRDGRIWIGDYHWGISVYDPNDKQFFNHNYAHGAPNTLTSGSVRSFDEDSEGKIIIGTDGGGVNIYDPVTQTFEWLVHDPADPNSLANNAVLYVLVDRKDNIWIGMWDGGLDYYDRQKKRYTHHRHDPDDPRSISSDRIFSIVQDKDSPDNLWLATHGSGLDYYDRHTNTFTRYRPGKESLGSHSISYDADDQLWLGSPGGLFRVSVSANRNVSFRKYTTLQGLGDDFVLDMFVDSKDRFWVGSNSYGFSLYDPLLDSFRAVGPVEGLAGNSATSFQEDKHGHLWVSTQKGLSKVEVKGNNFDNYTFCITSFFEEDGLGGDEFFGQASLLSTSGYMYFGTVKSGFVQFDPDMIRENKIVPKLHLTKFELMNPEEQGDLLKKTVRDGYQDIVLNHEQNNFTVSFAALNYTRPSLNEYAYKLEGLDKDWHYAGYANQAVYTNLNPGTYIFKVKGSNNDGYWNENASSVRVTITPPFVQTYWFRALLITGAILIILMIIKAINLRQEVAIRKQTEHDLNLARQKAEEASRIKSEFMANMSHEIRTPMNGIIGMTELALQMDSSPRMREYLSIVMSSSELLMSIINDILDFSKIEAGKLVIENTTIDVKELVTEVVTAFSAEAQSKNLQLDLAIEKDVPPYISGDPVRLRQVLYNLTGNAIKFTNVGSIKITVGKHLGKPLEKSNYFPLKISVVDTGIGIADEKFPVIFESFSQADTSTTRDFGGTGLGLAIAKSLVELMEGEMYVNSEVGIGSTFSFYVPCKVQQKHETDNTDEPGAESRDMKADENPSQARILVAEDNRSNQIVVRHFFSSLGYTIDLARDGQEAVDLLETNAYDLIFLDIQMPFKDGLTVFKEVRAARGPNSNKPFIAMTAFAMKEDREKCLKAGLNGYISKPVKLDKLREALSRWLPVSLQSEGVIKTQES